MVAYAPNHYIHDLEHSFVFCTNCHPIVLTVHSVANSHDLLYTKPVRYYYLILLGVITFGCSVAKPSWAAELLPDGSFEELDDSWQCTDNCTINIFDYFLASADAVEGVWYAYIFHDAEIYQDITIPSNATSISFWYDNQPDAEVPEDGSFTLTLSDITSGEVYVSEVVTEQADDWSEGLLTIPAALRGQTIRFMISNTAGFNRLDYFNFWTADDELADLVASYSTIRLRVLSAKGKAVEDANVYVKQNGERLDLVTLSDVTTRRQVATNKKGRTPKFLIAQSLEDNPAVKICIKKKKITECVSASPVVGVETNYDFTFTSKKVK
jgi:hypothetical protein